jgi:ABC-type sugar transport system ATPase subunit
VDAPRQPILEFREIGKAFFGVPVLRAVSFGVAPGSVVGLVGENGAGKSTLMNVLGGVLTADGGTMTVAGQPYAPRNARDAAARGVAFIHQELNLFSNLTVAENLHLPLFPRRTLGGVRLPLVDRGAMRRRAAELLGDVGLDVDPDEPVERLSPGERQLVEVAKAVRGDARVVIFDEPTSSLTSHEAERLFALIARLKARGVSMVYVSHTLGDVLRLADGVVVLRDGAVVGSGPAAEFDVEKLVTLMVGRTIQQLYPPRAGGPSDRPLLQAAGVSRGDVVRDVSLTVHEGEVVGISGLMGAGRTELARALFGLDARDAGDVRLRGATLRPSPRLSIGAGMAFLTEDRRAEGLLMEASVADNVALVALGRFARTVLKVIGLRRLRGAVADAVASVRLASAAADRQVARTLSGGNQQKAVFAKWLLNRPALFIVDEPTRGVDVGAKHEIYKLINRLVEGGAGVLLISSEIEELIGTCDRILVMSGGRITRELRRDQFDREQILLAALAGGRLD